jgi:hypothetical protein
MPSSSTGSNASTPTTSTFDGKVYAFGPDANPEVWMQVFDPNSGEWLFTELTTRAVIERI